MMVLFACNGCPRKETVDRSVYDSAMSQHLKRVASFTRETDSLRTVITSQDSSISTLGKTRDIFKQIANLQKKETDKYANLYRKYRALGDTPMSLISCDSLVDEYDILAAVNENEMRYSESDITAQYKAIKLRDTTIYQYKLFIASQSDFINKSDSIYNNLYKQYLTLQKKNKRTKRLGIIATVVAFIGGVLIAK